MNIVYKTSMKTEKISLVIGITCTRYKPRSSIRLNGILRLDSPFNSPFLSAARWYVACASFIVTQYRVHAVVQLRTGGQIAWFSQSELDLRPVYCLYKLISHLCKNNAVISDLKKTRMLSTFVKES